jgi:predicted dithiol-disulfide oxidoreductase (DUF899 family)
MALHDVRFPNESKEYRDARNELLLAERELRRQIERVAAQRRTLPEGGALKEDYVFEEMTGGSIRRVKFSELFGAHDTLVVYNFMFGPRDGARPCPSCTSMLDAMDGEAKHVRQRVSLAVIVRAPIDRVVDFARERGWRDLRLLSSANNSFNRDYHGEKEDGSQMPVLHSFSRRDGKIVHTWASELLFVPGDPGQHGRHIDSIWPLWNVFDITPEGRGTDWGPKLAY